MTPLVVAFVAAAWLASVAVGAFLGYVLAPRRAPRRPRSASPIYAREPSPTWVSRTKTTARREAAK